MRRTYLSELGLEPAKRQRMLEGQNTVFQSSFTASIILLALVTLFAMASADKDLEMLSKASDTFSNNIFSKVRESFKNKNVVISPFSLHPVLAMMEMGAKGKTKNELLKALAMPNIEVDWASLYSKMNSYLQDPAFTTASAIFCDSDIEIKSSYSDKVSSMGASLKQVSFAKKDEASATINDWVNTHTEGKVPKLYEPSDFSGITAMIIANAIHFKADWKYKFEAAEMKDFHSPTGIIEVPMMFRKENFLYGEPDGLQAQVVALPYKSSKFKMLVILPNKDTHLDVVQGKLAKIGLSQVWKSLEERKVEVSIPKFKIESQLELIKPLKSMGITHLFDSSADLSDILENPSLGKKLYVADVRQKVFIEVNEEGTEAAAATAARIQKRSLTFNEHFEANRPFCFIILSVDTPSGNILFQGEFSAPVENTVERDEL